MNLKKRGNKLTEGMSDDTSRLTGNECQETPLPVRGVTKRSTNGYDENSAEDIYNYKLAIEAVYSWTQIRSLHSSSA